MPTVQILPMGSYARLPSTSTSTSTVPQPQRSTSSSLSIPGTSYAIILGRPSYCPQHGANGRTRCSLILVLHTTLTVDSHPYRIQLARYDSRSRSLIRYQVSFRRRRSATGDATPLDAMEKVGLHLLCTVHLSRFGPIGLEVHQSLVVPFIQSK